MRIQPRNRVGKYKHSSWHNFKKRKRGWREYAIHPITVSVFGLLSYVGVHTAWAFDEAGKLESKFTIYNFSQENAREDSKGDGLSPSTNPEESTGETVKAVSDNPKSEEGQTPSQVQSPSSIEDKILKAWEGTGEGHIAVAVAKSESGLRTDAVGDIPLEYWHEGKKIGHSCGIFQIRVLPGRPDCETLKDVDKNIEFARKLYDKSGFYPWSNWKNNAYLKHL